MKLNVCQAKAYCGIVKHFEAKYNYFVMAQFQHW
jgi:hypothetical protein